MAIVGGTISFLVIAAGQDRKQLEFVRMQQFADAALDSGVAYVRLYGSCFKGDSAERSIELDAADLVPPECSARITLQLDEEQSNRVHITSDVQHKDRRVMREAYYLMDGMSSR